MVSTNSTSEFFWVNTMAHHGLVRISEQYGIEKMLLEEVLVQALASIFFISGARRKIQKLQEL